MFVLVSERSKPYLNFGVFNIIPLLFGLLGLAPSDLGTSIAELDHDRPGQRTPHMRDVRWLLLVLILIPFLARDLV